MMSHIFQSLVKISQEFPRSSSGVMRGQKAKFPKNSQDSHQGHQRTKCKISQVFPRPNVTV
ncbi:hypothetical protein HOLleu_20306 [Holothuria leucospilota]|uniref:Uncharacterized protein n=1 Tax=Holothuria leucospilota TaxID=206669 RepID=A0A9Q1C0W0_HOLLE|nr:hypothetical protein HOLleu_20306 [Holothuria leucospilota]